MTHNFPRLSGLVAVLLCCLWVMPLRAQETATANPPAKLTVPMRYDPPRIIAPLVRIRINGGDPENFILDTGAGYPFLLTDAYVRRAGLPRINEEVRVNDTGRLSLAEVQSIEMEAGEAHIPLNGLKRALIVDAPIESIAPGEKVAGVIGIALLAQMPAQLDFKAQTLTLYPSRSAFIPPPVAPFPLVASNGGTYNTPITIAPGVKPNFLIDTGAYTGQIEQALLDKLPKRESKTTMSGQVQGLYLTETAKVRAVTIGKTIEQDVVFDGVPTALGQGGRTSLLGMSLVQQFRLTFDIQNSLVYLESNPVPKFRIKMAESGVTLFEENGAVRVRRVEPKSPAAGLRPGDTIVSVDGIPVAGEAVFAVERLLDGVAGTEARIEVKRATTETVRFTRTAAFKSAEKFIPCFQGVVGRILKGKPLEILSLGRQSPLYTAGVRAGEQILRINSKELARQETEAIIELLRVRKALLIVQGNNGKQRLVTIAPLSVFKKGK